MTTDNTDPAGLSSYPEPTVQVPVSLIERATELLEKHYSGSTSARLRALLSQPTPTSEPPDDIGDRARSMIRWAEDYTGNLGLCYARCKEHDWRSRKRNVNSEHADPQNVRNLTFSEAVGHLRKKHKEYRIDPSTIRDMTPPTESDK